MINIEACILSKWPCVSLGTLFCNGLHPCILWFCWHHRQVTIAAVLWSSCRWLWRAGYGDTVDIECGQDGCNATREECQPIIIPTNDPAFNGKKCLEFVRSQAVPNLNCTMGKFSFMQN